MPYSDAIRAFKETINPRIPEKFNERRIFSAHLDRVARLLNGESVIPYEILIHSSSRCNLACEWCIGDNLNGRHTGTNVTDAFNEPANIAKAIRDILEYQREPVYHRSPIAGISDSVQRVERISFSGIVGEPLIAKESTLLGMSMAKEAGRSSGIFTNGTLIDDDAISVLANMDYVLISLDAGFPKTYSTMKCRSTVEGEDLFKSVIKNIEKLCAQKKKISSGVEVNVGFVLNSYNYKEIDVVALLCRDLGVSNLRFKTDIASYLSFDESTREMIREKTEACAERYRSGSFKVVMLHNLTSDLEKEKERRFARCFMSQLMSCIGADGNVYPCNYHPKKGAVSYGSVLDKSFKEIWESDGKAALDKNIPMICPVRCDPFKNRANNLLNIVGKGYFLAQKNPDYLRKIYELSTEACDLCTLC